MEPLAAVCLEEACASKPTRIVAPVRRKLSGLPLASRMPVRKPDAVCRSRILIRIFLARFGGILLLDSLALEVLGNFAESSAICSSLLRFARDPLVNVLGLTARFLRQPLQISVFLQLSF